MAMRGIYHSLCIRVLEDSEESGIFVVSVCCSELLLLRFWSIKPAFCNGQVEQSHVTYKAAVEMDFVLRVIDRAPNLPNSYYWGPFVLALCLDALPFQFRLSSRIQCCADLQESMKKCGKLTLLRYKS